MNNKFQPERRNLPRHLLRFTANVRLASGMPTVPCTVVDMTINGAQIVAQDIALPSQFTLLLDAQGTMTRNCKVMWCNGFTVGVRFITKPFEARPEQIAASPRGVGGDMVSSRARKFTLQE